MGKEKITDAKAKRLAAERVKFEVSEINDMLKQWNERNEREDLCCSEKVLEKLFSGEQGPVSDNEEYEYVKICVLNQIYGTNLHNKDIFLLSQYLKNNHERLNSEIREGDSQAVIDITTAIKEEKNKYCYSFATKYCSFAAPEEQKDAFPIYDSYMAVLYKTRWEVWNPENDKRFHKYDFDSWEGNETHNMAKYQNYRKAVYKMQKALKKEREMTVKELDQYLWMAMKTNLDKITDKE